MTKAQLHRAGITASLIEFTDKPIPREDLELLAKCFSHLASLRVAIQAVLAVRED